MENGSEQGSYDVDKGMAFGVLDRFFSIFLCVCMLVLLKFLPQEMPSTSPKVSLIN